MAKKVVETVFPFLNMTLDMVFKKFLKTRQKLCILFLQCFIPELRGRKIQNVKFVDTEMSADKVDSKQTRLDTLIELDNNELINVEIQCLFQAFFCARALCYWALSYISRFQPGEEYDNLRPTYLILLTDFDLLPKLKPLCASFSIRCNEQNEIVFSDHFKIVVVNLKKLGKLTIKQALKLDAGPKMGYLIKSAANMTQKDLNTFKAEGEAFQEAGDMIETLSQDAHLRMLADAAEKQRRDEWARHQGGIQIGLEKGLEKGLKQGHKEGHEQGHQEGLEQGIKQGHAAGRNEALCEIAIDLLGDMSPERVAKRTKLPLDQVLKLKKKGTHKK